MKLRPCLAALMLLAAPAASAMTLEARLARLERPGEALHYEEQRVSGLLSRPVVYTGRLEYDEAAGTLTKWVDSPRRARLTIEGDRLEAQVGDRPPRRVALSTRPELAALLDGLRALLAGDAAALERAFTVAYAERPAERDRDAWELRLGPRGGRSEAGVEVVVRGAGARIEVIETTLEDGERQVLTIVEAPEATTDGE